MEVEERVSLLGRAPEGIQEDNLAVRLRHSRVFLLYNLVVLLAVSVLLVSTAVRHHLPERYFLALEVLVTIAVLADLAIEVAYQGAHNFFCGKPFGGSDLVYVEPTQSGNSPFCDKWRSFVHRYGLLVMNWTQLIITMLCFAAFVFALMQDTSELREEEVSLALLLTRHAFYVVFLVASQFRTLRLQGGIRRVAEQVAFSRSGAGGASTDEWDINFAVDTR